MSPSLTPGAIRVTLRLLLAVLFLANSLRAQEPEPAPLTTLKLNARVVSLSAVVLDEHGSPVRGLTRDDFELKQDGHPQEIRYFSQDSTLPLTLALMVDTSSSQKMFLEDEIEASEKFFRIMLTRPSDRAVLVQFDYAVLQLQAMTAQEQALENALRFLTMPHPATVNRGGTLLYDAIYAASQRVLTGERGRRAMVILTDGEDNGSKYTLEQAIAAAQRADIVVYSVLYSVAESGFAGRPRATTPFAPTGRSALEALSKATGGHVFTVTPKTPLDLIYSQIADDMRLQYQIGYTPPDSKPGAYHKLELKPRPKHLTVQARQGFYTPG